MEGNPSGEQALAAYRERADRFQAELDERFYLHFGGIEPELGLEPIYKRYSDLITLEQAHRLGELVDDDPRRRELWRFACEGYLGGVRRAEDERIAELEVGLTADLDGEQIAFRMLRPEIANSADRHRRERLELLRNDLVACELNPLLLQARRSLQAAVRELGSDTYLDLYERFGFALEPLSRQCRSFLAETESLYERSLERLLAARLGLTLAEIARWDMPRLLRANDWDGAFPAGRMLSELKALLAGLGIDLAGQKNVEIDLKQRPNKSPRAFCAPIEIPGRVVLVIKPIGGPDDWRALLHEAGHTEHFAHTDAKLPFEDRRLGDNAVTEGWAYLFEHLIGSTAWLGRMLDATSAESLAWETAVHTLFFARRYCAKLLYELELHSDGDPGAMAPRYVELLRSATLIEPSASDFLADVDEYFYCRSYVRAWAFEAQVRSYLRDRFGSNWFERRDAGELLRELWSQGQRLTADEIVHELDGSRLDLGVLAAELRETLDSP